MGSGNWIVDNLNSALQTWNDKLAEIWTLISTTPEEFKGGGIWNVIVSINGALQAIGYALLVLFFVMGVVKTCGSFTEIKRPEVAFKCFIRFVLAQAAVTYGMELMNALFRIKCLHDPLQLLNLGFGGWLHPLETLWGQHGNTASDIAKYCLC